MLYLLHYLIGNDETSLPRGASRENVPMIEHAPFSLFDSGCPHAECVDEQNAVWGAKKRKRGYGEEKKGVRRREKGGAEKRKLCTLGPL